MRCVRRVWCLGVGGCATGGSTRARSKGSGQALRGTAARLTMNGGWVGLEGCAEDGRVGDAAPCMLQNPRIVRGNS